MTGQGGLVPMHFVIHLVILPVSLMLGAGCTSLTARQRTSLRDWQGFADRVTTYYGVSDVSFLVGEQPGPGGATMRPGGLMTFKPEMLEPLPAGQRRDFLLAHELAHWVLATPTSRRPARRAPASGSASRSGASWTPTPRR